MEILIVLYVSFITIACSILAITAIPEKEEKWVPSQWFIEEIKKKTQYLENANREIRAKSLLK